MRQIVMIAAVSGLTFLLGDIAFYPVARATDRDAIWKVVRDQCLVNENTSERPDPCVEIHPGKTGQPGFVVLKDLKGTAHYLVIPTEQISGIESPSVISKSAENWFSYAWQARHFLDQATGHRIPRDDIALAINSVAGRGQDQLHVHVSCILPKVKAEIVEQADRIGTSWSEQMIELDGKRYFAERIERDTLSGFNPIKIVADAIPGARASMGRMTIIVVGDGTDAARGGFYIFAGRSDEKLGDRGKAEDLLDNNCEHTSP